jgi:hypothetical protein
MNNHLLLLYKQSLKNFEIIVVGIGIGLAFYIFENNIMIAFLILIILAIFFMIIEIFIKEKYQNKCPYCERDYNDK